MSCFALRSQGRFQKIEGSPPKIDSFIFFQKPMGFQNITPFFGHTHSVSSSWYSRVWCRPCQAMHQLQGLYICQKLHPAVTRLTDSRPNGSLTSKKTTQMNIPKFWKTCPASNLKLHVRQQKSAGHSTGAQTHAIFRSHWSIGASLLGGCLASHSATGWSE